MAQEGSNDAGNGDGKTFSQDQVDAIVQDRLKRQKAQLEKDRPADDELEELRNAKKQLDAIEESSKDDLERAQTEIDNLKAELAKRDSTIEGLNSEKRTLSIREAVLKEASKAKFGEKQNGTFVDPEDAYLAIDKDKIEFDDEGKPSNIVDLVGQVAESKKHLLGARSTAVSLDGGAREPSGDRPDLTPEQEHAQWLAERI